MSLVKQKVHVHGKTHLPKEGRIRSCRFHVHRLSCDKITQVTSRHDIDLWLFSRIWIRRNILTLDCFLEVEIWRLFHKLNNHYEIMKVINNKRWIIVTSSLASQCSHLYNIIRIYACLFHWRKKQIRDDSGFQIVRSVKYFANEENRLLLVR